jgi:hypothetical protein
LFYNYIFDTGGKVGSNGGGDALLASLQRKTSDLSGGALVWRLSGGSLQ